jgi:hypothetical protein
MNPWYKEAYLQFFDQSENAFVENPDGVTGIYVSYNSGDIYNSDPAMKVGYSGLNIPGFKNKIIIANPVQIGQLLYSDGPGINIGEFNLIDSPSFIRTTGDGGEIVIGTENGIMSGTENTNIGNYNLTWQSKQMVTLGRGNYSDHSRYSYILGAANTISGIFLSNILGKNNILLANNDVNGLSQGNRSIFSGYESKSFNVLGDYNLVLSGGIAVTMVGNYNNINKSSNTHVFGTLNTAIAMTGDYNNILGNRNDGYTSANVIVLGNENTTTKATGDFIVGKSNTTSDTYYNYIYGQVNDVRQGSFNTLFGNSNQILGSSNQIFGKNTVNYLNSINSTIVGDTNYLSGDFNNYIFGSNNTADPTILNETIEDFPFLTAVKQRTTGFAGDYNYYIGDANRNSANDYSFVFGQSNNSIDNFKSFVIGSDNKFISNTNSYILGSSNQITGSTNSIFLGFNFASGTPQQGISGFGIKISPSGIDVYGTLRVNGVQMNIP